MKFPAPLCAALLPVLFSCAEQVSRIEHVREVPLKTTVVPAEDVGMHRTQATYLLLAPSPSNSAFSVWANTTSSHGTMPIRNRRQPWS